MSRPDPSIFGVLGNLTGGSSLPLLERRWHDVDVDGLDALIRKLRPEIALELPFCRSLRFTSWGDFHPAEIAERVPALKALLYARDEVRNPDAMRQHLAEARAPESISSAPASTPDSARPSAEGSSHESPPATGGADLLDSILSGPGESPAASVAAGSDSNFDRLIRSIVEEAGVVQDFAGEDARRTAIDEEIGRRMRAILHHPRFQSLEASWRGVRELVRHATDSERVRIRLLDLRLDEIAPGSGGDLEQSGLYPLLCGEDLDRPGAERFEVLITDFVLDESEDSLRAFAFLLALAERAGAPVLANAAADLCRPGGEPSPILDTLRSSPLGAGLSLCHPAVLLRLPYGPNTDPIDEFDFDEFAEWEGAEGGFPYVWGGAALAIGRALAETVMRTREIRDFPRFASVSDMPVHVHRQAGEAHSVGPMAELLGEPRIKELVDHGISPLVGFVGGDSAQIVSLRGLTGEPLFDR